VKKTNSEKQTRSVACVRMGHQRQTVSSRQITIAAAMAYSM